MINFLIQNFSRLTTEASQETVFVNTAIIQTNNVINSTANQPKPAPSNSLLTTTDTRSISYVNTLSDLSRTETFTTGTSSNSTPNVVQFPYGNTSNPTNTTSTNQSSSTSNIQPISLTQSLNPEEENFVSSSFVFSVSLSNSVSTNDEFSQGMILSGSEKPRVLAMAAENILNGFPKQNIIFFKRSFSNRFFVNGYTILRKEVFKNNNWITIKQITPDRIFVPDEFKDISDTLPFKQEDMFVIIDENIQINSVYSYKVEIAISPVPPSTPISTDTLMNFSGAFFFTQQV